MEHALIVNPVDQISGFKVLDHRGTVYDGVDRLCDQQFGKILIRDVMKNNKESKIY